MNADAETPPEPSLTELKGRLTDLQRELLTLLWRHFVQQKEWLTVRVIHSRYEKSSVIEAFSALGGDVVFEQNDYQAGNRYELSLLGAFLSDDGLELTKLFVRYFELQREFFVNAPEKKLVTSDEVAAALGTTHEQTRLLGLLIALGRVYGGLGWMNEQSWTVQVMTEADDFPRMGDLTTHVEQLVMKRYRPTTPVFVHERMNLARQSFDPFMLEDADAQPGVTPTSDVLKRRYQVFVSSTYSDLIEERRHVMQALLETKCIPSGMELFPAASTEQWALIKRVIDDCDYYIVIVAGKYGSAGRSGQSYTEMEFDYAVRAGKSVLGFYHEDTDTLTGIKLEKTDAARQKLAAFTAKVKQRLCRAWTTPDNLASAIKSAVLSEIELNPKPGWVRADSVPSADVVAKLKQRIADLEQAFEKNQRERSIPRERQIEVSANVAFMKTDAPQEGRWWSLTREVDSLNHTVRKSLIEWLSLFAPTPGESTNRHGLRRRFDSALSKELEPVLRTRATKQFDSLQAKVATTEFDQILDAVEAEKLLKRVAPPKHVGTKKMYWQLTPRGLQRLAELRAKRSTGSP